MVILIGGEKGGTGKTTIATNLAALRALAGHDVLLVDTDSQGSASYWASSRDEAGIKPRVACIQKFGKGLQGEVRPPSKPRSMPKPGHSEQRHLPAVRQTKVRPDRYEGDQPPWR